MIGALDMLRAGLAKSFVDGASSAEAWSDPDEMARARQRVHHDHGGAGMSADVRSILASVAEFRKSGDVGKFRDLKYVCLGIGALDSSGWSVLADEGLRSTVARAAEGQDATHRRLRCFQALLSSYFSFPANGKDVSAESSTGWRGLRGWLRAERDRILKLLDFTPPWFETLLRHPELLTNQPCDKFGGDLLRGDASGLNDARSGLAISDTSWVVEEAVFAQMSTEAASIADIERHSPKMSWMLFHLRAIQQAGEKAIVFCEFRDLQRTLQRAINEKFGFTPDVINGDVSADSAHANNRQKRIKAFQDRPGFGVIVLSPLAVGFGVNIQAANHVIHFTRTWNPAKEDQATDRAYRIGQQRDVHVYYPVVVAHDFLTFDAKLDSLLGKKRELSDDMLNGAGDVSPADFGDLEAPDGGNAFSNEPLTADDIGALNGDAFEAFCALLWSKMGYSRTVKTKRAGDEGVDVVAIKGKEGALIQCKSSTVEGKELGWEAVKDVSAGAPAYAARYPGIRFVLFAVTNRRFNGAARAQATVLKVQLIEGDELADMLARHPMRRGELERFLLASWT